MNAKEVSITVVDIASLTGLKADTVRRHQRDGWFDLHDLGGTIKYIHAHMVLRELEPVQERRGNENADKENRSGEV